MVLPPTAVGVLAKERDSLRLLSSFFRLNEGLGERGGQARCPEVSPGQPRVGAERSGGWDSGVTAPGSLALCALFTMSQGMISWGVDVFLNVDFLFPRCEPGLGLGLESKARSCLEGNKRLGCSDEAVNNNRRGGNKKDISAPECVFRRRAGVRAASAPAAGAFACAGPKAQLGGGEISRPFGSGCEEAARVRIKSTR